MNLFFIKNKEKEYHFAFTDVLIDENIEIVFIKNQLPGRWVYISESNIIKRIDLESIDEHEVLVKQVGTEFSTDSLMSKLDIILKSQVNVDNRQEYWTRIKYDITDSEDGGKTVNVVSHKVAFYFGVNGELKGINTWE